jgi:uncharacterized protein (TIGR02271 family)
MANDKSAVKRRSFGGEQGLDEVAAIPLVEERLSIAKRQVESGRVRVRVHVEEREETVTENLMRDDLQIERVPRNERLTKVPHVRLEGNTTIVPVVEEVLVVEKALMLVEEIHISRRSVSEPTNIPVTLRAERAEIERETGGEQAKTEEHS